MKALILRGKYKGTICEVSQWCNDWFMLDPKGSGLKGMQAIDIMRKPFSPSALLFTAEGFKTIQEHKNNGILFGLYALHVDEPHFKQVKGQLFSMGFKKRKAQSSL